MEELKHIKFVKVNSDSDASKTAESNQQQNVEAFEAIETTLTSLNTNTDADLEEEEELMNETRKEAKEKSDLERKLAEEERKSVALREALNYTNAQINELKSGQAEMKKSTDEKFDELVL